ncbi:carbohydrate kinase family protein [Zobellia alginiliquefaciens]|uniref:carbohydrate kinase family protein n=1 Tax=Zobellia alginiliquefaciens TaxID=3032586 RepID=UPI0023E287EE|nr:carbohydrate kinase [Zobellia alginiliquefaciens]
MKKIKAICFGEVLFDIFPTHSKIGGAPLNVSLRLQSYGIDSYLISAIGKDEFGKKIISYLKKYDVNTNGIEINPKYETGRVNVVLNDKGVASYDIAYPVAWDKISLKSEDINYIKKTDFFIYGCLASRDKTSLSTLRELLKIVSYKVFDVNLRAPHYTNELVAELMLQANFIKFNDEELFEIAANLGSRYNSMEQTITYISVTTNTETICVTKGAYGAVLYHQKVFYYNSGYRIKVLDTVGSGDSFLASVLFKLFNGNGPQQAINFGCAVGAMVAKSEGANPILTMKQITEFMNP